jgi:predicted DNA-binding antitoxin AbrB/MazE fold protein
MPRTITAIYEHGVFVPQAPVNLPEHATVKVLLLGGNRKRATERFQGLISAPLVAAKFVVPSREERHER